MGEANGLQLSKVMQQLIGVVADRDRSGASLDTAVCSNLLLTTMYNSTKTALPG